jgi:LacI family transcriptional regulator
MPRLRDIARHANTSVTTVSLVLNGRDGPVRISETTRQQVLQAARELGYTPNIAARRLRGANGERGTVTIGVLLPLDERLTISIRALAPIRRQLDAWAESAGRSMPDVLIETYAGGHLDQVKSLTSDPRYNGAILYNTLPADDDWLAATGALSVPLVLVQRSIAGHSWVNSDNFRMGGEVAAHLLPRGPRLAVVRTAIPAAAQTARVEGFAHRFRHEVGQDLPADAVVRAAFSEVGGYDATRRLLDDMQARGDFPPHGLFATTDLMAVGALRALREAGLQVPDDVAVVGYDDDPIAPFTNPPLSSVNAAFESSAERAVETLLALIKSQSAEPITALLEAQLVIRESSALPDALPRDRAPKTAQEA